jgi:hypothetical protein
MSVINHFPDNSKFELKAAGLYMNVIAACEAYT